MQYVLACENVFLNNYTMKRVVVSYGIARADGISWMLSRIETLFSVILSCRWIFN